jgi:Zn-dependent protease with chaperone function
MAKKRIPQEDDKDPGSLSPELTLLIEEYRSVREEELIAVQGQVTTLRYGIAACVVLIGFAAQQHGDRYLGWAVALALVPLVVLFSAVIWMGEYERGARSGRYVAGLEARVNARLGPRSDRPLRWEGWLREGGNAPSRLVGGHHRYLAIACVFIGFQVASVVMGLHFYWHKHSHDPSRHWLVPTAVTVNTTILLMLLGYFRSAYERFREYTTEPEERRTVRLRVRMRAKLYGLFALVGFTSTPPPAWLLGVAIVWVIPLVDPSLHPPVYLVLVPALLWMAIVPLVSSRGLMRELFERRILEEKTLDPATLVRLRKAGILGQLTAWESEQLRVVDTPSINAPSMGGKQRHITVTTAALEHRKELPGLLAHEVGHHRLHHLYPLALSYLYLWPYLYYDDAVRVLARSGLARRGRYVTARIAYSVLALPGWLAWVLLRLGWRAAEYDADRFACVSGYGKELAAALKRAEAERQERQPRDYAGYLDAWRTRVTQRRCLGYLPVPNEHPLPRRRLDEVEKRLWVIEKLRRKPIVSTASGGS